MTRSVAIMKCPTRGKRFYCREWVVGKILNALDSNCQQHVTSNGHLGTTNTRPSSTTSSSKSFPNDENGGFTIVLVGGPGSGKTAIFSELVWPSVVISRQAELNSRLLAYHFCQCDDADSVSVSQFICGLVGQLMESPHLPDFKDHLREPKRRAWLSSKCDDKTEGTACDNGAIRMEQFPKEAFKKTVLDPLNESTPPKDRLLWLVDLAHDDSCATSGYLCASAGIAELLSHFRRQLPKWLTLVITTRRQCRFVVRAFQGCRRIVLDDLRRSCVVRDIQQYILHRLDEEESLRLQLNMETAEMLNRLHIKSNGCILYLELVLDGVVEGFAALNETQHIPSTLNGLYLWLCQRHFPRKHHFAKIQPIFDVMLATKRPLTADELFQCIRTSDVAVPVDEFLERMKSVSRLLWVDEEKCTFFHHSFAEWLLDVKYSTQKYLCDKSNGHSYLAMWYSARGAELSLDECVEFAYHLSKMRIKPPLDESHLPLWLVQSGAPVQRLVLANFAYDEATTRLLIDAGADFVSLDFRRHDGFVSSQRSALVDDEREEVGEESAERKIQAESMEPVSMENVQQSVFKAKVEGPVRMPMGGVCKQDYVSDEALLTDETTVDADGRTALHNAASDGRVPLVKSLLARGAFCDVEDQNGDTPLVLASRHGHAELCEILLESGADVNHVNREGWTALRAAAWGGYLSVIETLLRYDVAVDCCSNDGRTALRAAAWGGHEDCVRILLSVGAEPNKQDGDGRTALMAAAYMGHAEVVDILMNSGADPNIRDRDGRTALNVAAVCSSATPVDHVGVAKLLLDGGTMTDCADNNGKTPLQCAASEGNEPMCRLLLERGADVDHTDSSQCTPLLAAAAVGHGDIVQLLLSCGADIDSIDAEGRTVLSGAAAYGSCKVVRMLLEKGLDEMHKDNAGWIPLHHAAFEGHAEVCQLLCEYNSRSVHVIDNEGRHPLLLAVEEGQIDAARCLIEYGADVNKPSLDGQTCLRIAAVAGNKPLCHLLISRGANVDYNDLDGRSTLYALVFERQLEMAEHLLSFGTRVDSRDPQGRTPLHVACWQGDLAAVELLIKYGADIDVRDNEENTPLMLAVWRGHASVVKCLLSHRVEVNAWCKQTGASALSIAAQEGREDIVKLLLQHNADPEHTDRYGRTPSVVAQKAGKEKIVSLLNDFQRNTAAIANTAAGILLNGATMDTTLSGSSGETKASSGYMSLSQALCTSLESPFTGTAFAHPASPSATVACNGTASATKAVKRNALCSLRSAGRATVASSSNKSTLSSTCGSPDDDFSRRLLEHSLPKCAFGGRSRPTSICIQSPGTSGLNSVRGGGEKEMRGESEMRTCSILDALAALLVDNRSDDATEPTPPPESIYDDTPETIAVRPMQNGDDSVHSSGSDTASRGRVRIVTNPNYRQSTGEQKKLLRTELIMLDSPDSAVTVNYRPMDEHNRKETGSPLATNSITLNYAGEMIVRKETQL